MYKIKHSKRRFFGAVTDPLVKILRRKIGKKNLNVFVKSVKMDKKMRKIKQIINFTVCTYKSQNFAPSQLNFAPLHDGETVTFRNSV